MEGRWGGKELADKQSKNQIKYSTRRERNKGKRRKKKK